MDLYSVIQLKPASGQQAATAEQQLLVSGDFPAEVSTALSPEQVQLVKAVIIDWHQKSPRINNANWQQQRNRVLKQCLQHDYNFLFEFHSGDNIMLDDYQADIENLFQQLEKICSQAEINVKLSNSI